MDFPHVEKLTVGRGLGGVLNGSSGMNGYRGNAERHYYKNEYQEERDTHGLFLLARQCMRNQLFRTTARCGVLPELAEWRFARFRRSHFLRATGRCGQVK